MRVVFAGTPRTAVPSLAALLQSRHEVVAVLTRPDAAAGRGRRVEASPVAMAAEADGLEVLKPRTARDPDFLDRLRALEPDCAPVVAYGALLPPATLEIPRHGWVNLHFSLLPAWRGAAPVQRAVLAGDEMTGASTFQIEEGLDTGPVYGVITEPIKSTDTSGDLLERLSQAGARLLVATLDGIESGELVPVRQPADGITYAHKLTVDDGRVVWSAAAVHVDRQIRACTPDPGAWTTFRGERVKLDPIRPLQPAAAGRPLAPGELAVEKRTVLVGTGTGPMQLGTLQAQGKRRMPAPDWARGVRARSGERFE